MNSSYIKSLENALALPATDDKLCKKPRFQRSAECISYIQSFYNNSNLQVQYVEKSTVDPVMKLRYIKYTKILPDLPAHSVPKVVYL